MTPDKFRLLALSFAGASEGAHMGHPDFRVAGRIFASLGPDGTWGMVKVPADVQRELVTAEPEVFGPASGAWGRGGATIVTLKGAKVASVRAALRSAWRHTLPKGLAEAFDEEKRPPRGDQGSARASKSGGVGKRRGSSNSSPRKREPR